MTENLSDPYRTAEATEPEPTPTFFQRQPAALGALVIVGVLLVSQILGRIWIHFDPHVYRDGLEHPVAEIIYATFIGVEIGAGCVFAFFLCCGLYLVAENIGRAVQNK